MVMCRQPAILAPFNGWEGPNSARIDMRPGISASASRISLRPHSANEISATLCGREKSMDLVTVDIFCFYYFGGKGKFNELIRQKVISVVSSNFSTCNSVLMMGKMANAGLP